MQHNKAPDLEHGRARDPAPTLTASPNAAGAPRPILTGCDRVGDVSSVRTVLVSADHA
jgi:hypothetical protein